MVIIIIYFYLKGNQIYVVIIGFEETKWSETTNLYIN